ncbi:MAG: hypothetical protein ACLU4J_01790 [Butyricimonas paravirosa]
MPLQLPGIANGAMLYDGIGCCPLFNWKSENRVRLFAFEIAKKIGLPKEILDDAANKDR